jgi:hypothetical protein
MRGQHDSLNARPQLANRCRQTPKCLAQRHGGHRPWQLIQHPQPQLAGLTGQIRAIAFALPDEQQRLCRPFGRQVAEQRLRAAIGMS